ncbi:hypothetical protein EC844_101340 [Acinetobacter calcoaceticus]|uniref:Uncharacterized protein n=1 Tax=Acinetobacter calcoaceticus TaxID=471 RepID=A0A4R1Y406_ACICA|nr:hypothetical protein EC844_101340 [Acinetobacter calcoaceticus]
MRRIILIIGVVIIAIAAVFFYQHSTENNEQANRQNFDLVMAEKMRDLYGKAQDWSKPMQFEVQDKRLKGDYKKLSEFILNLWVNGIETRNQYLRDLNAAQWTTFLNVERLDADRKQGYKQTEQMLKTVHQVTERYQQQSNKNKLEALATAKVLDVREDLRAPMQAKLEHNLKLNKESELILLELQILDKADAMFEMLKKYQWQVDDGKILFYQDAQVKQFNLLYQDLLTLNAKIEQKKTQNAEGIEEEF